MSVIPIRLRLTAGFAVVMAVVLAAASFLLLDHLAASLDRTLDQGLRSRAADVTALIQQADTGLSQAAQVPVDRGAGFAQVLTGSGRVFDETHGLPRAPLLSAAARRRALTGPAVVRRSRVRGTDVRLFAVPVHAQGRRLLVVVGTSLASRDQALASLRRELLLGGPLALLVASLVGYLLAAAALRPVEQMRRRARVISERRLSERLPVSPARDEIGRLGLTLNDMLARIEQRVERERGFVADASHELRSPLALLRAEVDLALESKRSREELLAALRSIGEESDRLSQLAEDLLLLARLDEGRLPLRSEELEAPTLLDDVAARFARRADGDGRAVVVQAGKTTLHGDRLRLEQAIGNLVENALRHGEGTVTLEASAVGELVEVAVRDEGAGFPPEFVERAFERFARADGARSGGGAGLGLSIVEAIAEAHGGAAFVAADADGGEVRLRLRRCLEADAESHDRSREPSGPAATRGSGSR